MSDETRLLARRVSEEGALPVSAYKAKLEAREEQMRTILRCYMENAELVSRLKVEFTSAPEENLYDYYVEYIREIEEDDHSVYGRGYFSQYGTRQATRRSIIVDLIAMSRKFKVKVNAPSLKTVGWSGKL